MLSLKYVKACFVDIYVMSLSLPLYYWKVHLQSWVGRLILHFPCGAQALFHLRFLNIPSPSAFKTGPLSTGFLCKSAKFCLLQAGRRTCSGQGPPCTSRGLLWLCLHCLFKAFASQAFPGREESVLCPRRLLAASPLPVGKIGWQVVNQRRVPCAASVPWNLYRDTRFLLAASDPLLTG